MTTDITMLPANQNTLLPIAPAAKARRRLAGVLHRRAPQRQHPRRLPECGEEVFGMVRRAWA